MPHLPHNLTGVALLSNTGWITIDVMSRTDETGSKTGQEIKRFNVKMTTLTYNLQNEVDRCVMVMRWSTPCCRLVLVIPVADFHVSFTLNHYHSPVHHDVFRFFISPQRVDSQRDCVRSQTRRTTTDFLDAVWPLISSNTVLLRYLTP